ncbi:MAG: transposase [Nitrosospira sp.]|nr:transposase [Nitrosospira sp.]
MVRYRRVRVAGGTYFFTVALADRRAATLVRHADMLREAFRVTRERHPFTVDAIVVLPEHLHTIWTLPEGDDDYPARWQLIKTRFTRGVSKLGIAWPPLQSPWQRRYWEHVIRDDGDFRHHVDYIHYNPVKHGHTVRVRDWPYSSFHRYVKNGMLSIDWGSGVVVDDAGFGEWGG